MKSMVRSAHNNKKQPKQSDTTKFLLQKKNIEDGVEASDTPVARSDSSSGGPGRPMIGKPMEELDIPMEELDKSMEELDMEELDKPMEETNEEAMIKGKAEANGDVDEELDLILVIPEESWFFHKIELFKRTAAVIGRPGNLVSAV